MARDSKAIFLNLAQLRWREIIVIGGGGGLEGGPPSVHPFLWTVFFRVDGSTLQLNDAGMLTGSATIVTTPGSHGNLGAESLQVGNSDAIPDDLGLWNSTLQPIPVAPSLRGLIGDDLPGFFGAVAVIMIEGGHVSDHGAEAGHAALNTAVETAIDAVLGRIGPDHQMITQDDIDSVTAGINDKVSSAIQNNQNLLENLWSLTGKDATAGYHTWVWNQDQFPDSSHQQMITEKLSTDAFGLWEIDGEVSVTNQCPAAVAEAVLEAFFGIKGQPNPAQRRTQPLPSDGANAMRQFRDDGGMKSMPGLASWWTLAAHHSPELALLLGRHRSLRESMGVLLTEIGPLLRDMDVELPEGYLTHVERALTILTKRASPRLRDNASRAAVVLPQLHGKTVRQAMHLLSTLRSRNGTKP
jgi:hypothetical protein